MNRYRISKLNNYIDRLDAILQKALARNLDVRYDSAERFMKDMEYHMYHKGTGRRMRPGHLHAGVVPGSGARLNQVLGQANHDRESGQGVVENNVPKFVTVVVDDVVADSVTCSSFVQPGAPICDPSKGLRF